MEEGYKYLKSKNLQELLKVIDNFNDMDETVEAIDILSDINSEKALEKGIYFSSFEGVNEEDCINDIRFKEDGFALCTNPLSQIIYDKETNSIIIKDKNNISSDEYNAILTATSANISSYSLAAEIKFHADLQIAADVY